MAQTPTNAWPYCGPNDAPDVPYWQQRQAEKGDTFQTAIQNRATALEALRYIEYVGPIVTTTAGGTTTVGALAPDTVPAAMNNDFVQPDIAGRLKILRDGIYSIELLILPSTQNKMSIRIRNITANTNIASAQGGDYGAWELSTGRNIWLAANTVLEFAVVTAAATTYGSNISVNRHGI